MDVDLNGLKMKSDTTAISSGKPSMISMRMNESSNVIFYIGNCQTHSSCFFIMEGKILIFNREYQEIQINKCIQRGHGWRWHTNSYRDDDLSQKEVTTAPIVVASVGN